MNIGRVKSQCTSPGCYNNALCIVLCALCTVRQSSVQIIVQCTQYPGCKILNKRHNRSLGGWGQRPHRETRSHVTPYKIYTGHMSHIIDPLDYTLHTAYCALHTTYYSNEASGRSEYDAKYASALQWTVLVKNWKTATQCTKMLSLRYQNNHKTIRNCMKLHRDFQAILVAY